MALSLIEITPSAAAAAAGAVSGISHRKYELFGWTVVTFRHPAEGRGKKEMTEMSKI